MMSFSKEKVPIKCSIESNFCPKKKKKNEPSNEKKALCMAGWFLKKVRPNARPAVIVSVWPPTKSDILVELFSLGTVQFVYRVF